MVTSVQENAILSILADPTLLNDPLTVREGALGFQQTTGRKLQSEAVKVCCCLLSFLSFVMHVVNVSCETKLPQLYS